jgi:hypothetical protein
MIEDFDHRLDVKFIEEYLIPYLSDLYKDLALRSFVLASQSPEQHQTEERLVDKVTFIQYCNLPGIISERLLKIIMGDSSSDSSKNFISEEGFIKNMTTIFVSDVEMRMRLTFDM